MLWILDAGHGIETKGKRSPGKKKPNDGKPGIVEYEFNRDIVERIDKQLREMGIPTHVMCQDERTMPIAERKEIARTMISEWEGAAAFISVHSNAAGPGGWFEKARGVRCFTQMNPFEPHSVLAEYLAKNISEQSGLRKLSTRDHITRKGKKYSLGILKRLPCPAVLTENGFMTSVQDCKILTSDIGRQNISDGHVGAILKFQDWVKSK